MKVYVDELPSCCEDCVCHNGVSGRCKLLHRTTFDIPPRDCPLQSLTDYTKQVRKEICDKIRKEFEPSNATKIDENVCTPTNESMLVSNGFKSCKRRLFKKLDEIQGE